MTENEARVLPFPDRLFDQPKWNVDLAHEHCNQNRLEVLASELCGCFCCLAIFPPSEIHVWWSTLWDDPDYEITAEEDQAICPHCWIDSVIGSASGYPITLEFLTAMEKHWFNQL